MHKKDFLIGTLMDEIYKLDITRLAYGHTSCQLP